MTIETKHTKELWRVVAHAGREKLQGSFDTKREAVAFIEFWPAQVQIDLRVTGPHSVGLDVNASPPADWHTMKEYRQRIGLWAEPMDFSPKTPPVFSFDPFVFMEAVNGTLGEIKRLPEGQDPSPQALSLAQGFGTVLASIADSLQRIAKAQETQIALAQIDIDQTIETAVEQLAQERAEQLMKEKTSRSVIGGKNIT